MSAPAVGRASGQVTLRPIDGSIDRTAIVLDIELERPDGVLVLGDLRRAAERVQTEGRFEAAHRLWTVVGEAAGRVDADALVARATAMADGALTEARATADKARTARRGVSYDYQALAADRSGGMSQAAVAAKWGCSTGTVARAVRYVRQRDELVEASPELLDRVHRGTPVGELANSYEIPTKIMRWIVSDFWDRRG